MHGHKVVHTRAILNSKAAAFFAEAVAKGIMATESDQFLETVGFSKTAFYATTAKGEVIGVIAYDLKDTTARISLIYVEETSRKLGVSTLLLSALKGYLTRSGATELRIDVPNTEDTVLADLIEKNHSGWLAAYRYVIDLSDGADDDELLGQPG